MQRDELGDGDDERDLGLDGLDDGFGGELGRDEDGADVWLGLVHGLEGRVSSKLAMREWSLVDGTSRTVSKTGKPRCIWPPLPGETPPTTFVA